MNKLAAPDGEALFSYDPPDATGKPDCGYFDDLLSAQADGRLEEVLRRIHDHYYARAMTALQGFVEATEALVTLELAQGDAAPSVYTGYATQKEKEFEFRSRALSVLYGDRAIVPACRVNSEMRMVERAMRAIREAGGDLAAARDNADEAALLPWIDTAAEGLVESSVATTLTPLAVAGDRLTPLTERTAEIPLMLHRGTAARKAPHVLCADGLRDLVSIPEDRFNYVTQGSLFPSFVAFPPAEIEELKAAAGVRERGCVPLGEVSGSAGPIREIGALRTLDAIAAVLYYGSTEPPENAPFNHTQAARLCGRAGDDAPSRLNGSYVSALRAGIAEEVGRVVGGVERQEGGPDTEQNGAVLKRYWKADVAVGELRYASPGPPAGNRYLLVGRKPLEILAGGMTCSGEVPCADCDPATAPCRVAGEGGAGLTTTPYVDDTTGTPVAVWPYLARAFEAAPDESTLIYFKPGTDALSASHPVRQYCEAVSGRCSDLPWYVSGKFADDLFLLREAIPQGAQGGEPRFRVQPITLYVYEEGTECPTAQMCFAVADDRFGWVVDWYSVADLTYDSATQVPRFKGGAWESLARRVLAREPGHCVEPRYNSLGLENRLVPALENELIDNLDPYENSFTYYLSRAKGAAELANGRVKLAVESEHDLRTKVDSFATEARLLEEEARDAVELICGQGTGATGCSTTKIEPATTLGQIGGLLPPAGNVIGAASMALVGDRCPAIIEESAPDFEGLEDANAFASGLDEMHKKVVCAAIAVIDGARAIEIRGLPVELQDGVLDISETGAFGGQYLQSLLAIENELLDFSNVVISIGTRMDALGAEIAGAKSHVDSMITESNAGKWWNVAANVLQGLGSVFGGFGLGSGKGSPWSTAGGIGGGLGGAAAAIGNWQEMEEQSRKELESAEAFVQNFMAGMFETIGDLQMKANTLEASANRLMSLNESLELLELQQQHERNRALRQLERAEATLGIDDAYVWTSMSKDNLAARKAIQSSLKLSYVARKAIEFRLVVDLEQEKLTSAVMNSPDSWANDIFLIENRVAANAAGPGDGGYDPETAIARADAFELATTAYVDHLSDFVGFYSFVYPFQSGLDTAVLSLKDDFVDVAMACDDLGVAAGGFCRCVTSAGDDITDQVMALVSPPSPPATPFFVACTAFCAADPPAPECYPAIPGAQRQTAHVEPPYDFGGALLRERFRVKCNGTAGMRPVDLGPCGPAGVQYYQLDFAMAPSGAEGERLSRHGQVAAGRYNYRWDGVAINLVGSNVKVCDPEAGDAAACYGAAFIPYDLEHHGKVSLGNHDGELRRFAMSTGRIRSGKALAAERVLTSPLAQADEALIGQYVTTELRGRPLHGVYTLRLRGHAALQFEELEDIQLLVRYRSWTAFDPLE